MGLPSVDLSFSESHAESSSFAQQGANINTGIMFSPFPQTPAESAPDFAVTNGGVSVSSHILVIAAVILLGVLVWKR